MDRNARKKWLERVSCSRLIFPGGDHPTRHCTACAQIVTERFGGEVRGYHHADNPKARVGAAEEGHDFAITPGGFLVDPWLFHYYEDSPVLDLNVSADEIEATAR